MSSSQQEEDDDGSCFSLQCIIEVSRKRVKRSRLDLPEWKCGQGIWVKYPPGIFCENLLTATLTSQENGFREMLG